MVVGADAVAELADPRKVRISHLAWQSPVTWMSTEKRFATAELAATQANFEKHLLWRLEMWDLQIVGVEPWLDGAETVDVGS